MQTYKFKITYDIDNKIAYVGCDAQMANDTLLALIERGASNITLSKEQIEIPDLPSKLTKVRCPFCNFSFQHQVWSQK